MIYWISSLLAYAIGMALCYIFIGTNKTSALERVWFSIFWPCVALFYPLHYCYNKWLKK